MAILRGDRTWPVAVWIDSYQVGYKTLGLTNIGFIIIGDAQWECDIRLITFPIPGGNVVQQQIMGKGPWRVTYDVLVATADEYRSLAGNMGASGTLTMFAGTAGVPTYGYEFGGVAYERVDLCTIELVGSPQYLRDRTKCSVTFTVPWSDF